MNALHKKAEQIAQQDAEWIDNSVKSLLTPLQIKLSKFGIGRFFLKRFINIEIAFSHSLGSNTIEIYKDGKLKYKKIRKTII